MATKKITKIISIENGDNYVADIEDIENRITQNSSNLETVKQELSNKCDTVLSDAKAYTDTEKNEALSQAKAYTDQEKAKLFNSTNGTFTGQEYFRDVNNSVLRFNGGNTHDGGASLMLYGKNAHAPGHFDLVASTKEDTSHAKQFVGMPDGTLVWDSKNIVRSVNGVNADTSGNVQLGNIGAITGEIKWFAFGIVPDGYIICNGAKVSRETYADLFAAIGTAFGSGDGSTTFDLPDLVDKFAEGSRTVGTYKGAGLPNITGYVDGYINMVDSGGAFYLGNKNKGSSSDKDDYYHSFIFDASRASSIYGNSSTVQPPALTLLPCIKY